MPLRSWIAGCFARLDNKGRRSRPRRRLRLEELERRLAPSANACPLAAVALPRNLEGNLAALYAMNHAPTGQLATLQSLLNIDRTGRPLVDVWVRGETAPVAARLGALGAEVHHTSDLYHVVEASLDVARLPEAAVLPGVLSVTPVYRPVLRAGSVQTQGDAVVSGPTVRAAGFDGAPFLVGVLGDSALDLAASQATGDLPPVVDRYLEFPVSDEGRAMLEIVHDVAPGAALAHHSAILSELSFAEGIRKLAAAGSRVIVDDVWYLSEPFFQDGIVAQAVNDVTADGVFYITAAGNEADDSYEAAFVDANPTGMRHYHDFDPSAAPDTLQRITVPAGMGARLVLQWDDPFYTPSGVTHDFDVRIYDAGGTLIAFGLSDNPATRQPLEVVAWLSSGSGVYQVEIERRAGTGSSLLKYILVTSSAAGTIDEFATNSGTIVGHAAAAGAVAVGAVPYYSPITIQPFSSRGNATIYFDPAGGRLATPQLRLKPDVVAPDDVNTTFFGVDIPEDSDPFPNFKGTSAAAPHVAGVAALILDVNPHLTRNELYNVLTLTAVDLGAPGRDSAYGFGRIDALAAGLVALVVPDVTPPTAQLVSPIAIHGWEVSRLEVRFSEPLAAATATAAANYTLRGAGADGALGTPDDVIYTVSPSYDADARQTNVTFSAPATVLARGLYRLTLRAAGGLTDEAGNPLAGGADPMFNITIAPKSQPVAAESASQLDARPNGTAVLVYPNNATIGYAWPQVMVGSFGSGGRSSGPFRSAPTDMARSLRVVDPDVAVNNTGGVIVYGDLLDTEFPPSYAVGYQMLDALGRPTGPRQVAARAQGSLAQSVRPRVDMNAAGAFAVVFPHLNYDPSTGGTSATFKARLFDAAGSPLTAVFPVNQTAPGAFTPVVALAPDGTSVYVWEGAEIHARRFSPSGASLGGEFVVNTTTLGSQKSPEIAMAGDGSFAVVWRRLFSDAGDYGIGIFAQRFDPAGNKVAGEIRVHSAFTFDAQIAMAPDGRFVVAWQSTNGDGIFAQRFLADGTPFGLPYWVSQGAPGTQVSPRVAMADSGDFVILRRDGDSPGAPSSVRWFSWSGLGDVVPYGPWVRSQAPAGSLAGPVSSITITFDRLINPATFAPNDVQLIDPVGRVLPISSVTTFDNQTFTIAFPAQQLPGLYRFLVGPDIADTAGLLMDEDGSTVGGQTSDGYNGRFTLLHRQTAAFPFTEGFEAGGVDLLPGFWSFSTSAGATTVVTPTGGPHGGGSHLRFGQTYPSNSNLQQAILLIDLSAQAGATDLALDFWLKTLDLIDLQNQFNVYASGDGVSWSRLNGSDLIPVPSGYYQHHAFDLDDKLRGFGIALDSSVYLRFDHYGRRTLDEMTLDDVRISNRDVFGPRLTTLTPAGMVPGPIGSLTVTFSEEMSAASFVAADVYIVGPVGNIVGLAGNPVDSGDHRTFTLNLAAPQALAGAYAVQIGPDILDAAGNLMNQDNDEANGEPSQDQFRGTVSIGPPVAQTLAYAEGFESGSLGALAGWSLAVAGGATIAVAAIGATHTGSYHLHFDQTYAAGINLQEATLLLDLSAHTGATNLALDFWLQTMDDDGLSNYLNVLVSGDGSTWRWIPTLVPFPSWRYAHFVYDLDQLLTTALIAFDRDVYVRFIHHGLGPADEMALDDIRVRVGPLNHAPTLTAVGAVPGAVEDQPHTITYAALAAAANEADLDGDAISFRVEGVASGTLTKGGLPVVPGVTVLAAGESLVWTPAADANGTLTAFFIRAWDGDLISAAVVPVPVAITPVNDPPGFTAGPNQTINEDAGPQTVAAWAASIRPGPPNESSQAVTFLVTGDRPALFAAPPAISPTGTLTYRPAPNAFGTATVTVRLMDNGGTALGGIDTSAPQTFTITVLNTPETWTGAGADANWTTTANWRGGLAPVAGDLLVFPAGAARLANTNTFPAGTGFASITFSGVGYTLSGNALALQHGLSATAAGSNSITLPLTLTADQTFTVAAGSQLTLAGAVSGATTLTKAGAGSLTLSGAVLLASFIQTAGTLTLGAGGSLTVAGGYLQTAGTLAFAGGSLASAGLVDIQGGAVTGNAVILGNVRNAGTIDVGGAGAAGLFFVLGDYEQTAGGVLNIELGGPGIVSQYDLLYVTGTVTLDGTLNVSLLGGYVPSAGDLFVPLLAGARSGAFATMNGLTISPTRAIFPLYFDLGLILATYES